jgi:hypothetical protein
MHEGWFELGEEIAETAAMIDAATHRLLTMLREFDRVGGWFTAGALSCAHWLSWRVGMDLGAAREKVRVARALEGLAKTIDVGRKHWIEGGETSLANTMLVCRRHHRHLHEYGFTTDGNVFRDRAGNAIAPQGERRRWEGDWRVAGVSAESNQPGWDGDRVDWERCVDAVA